MKYLCSIFPKNDWWRSFIIQRSSTHTKN